MPKEKIFIVEDQEVIYTNIKFILERKGYSVCGIATTGKDALSKIELHPPDLILMDIGLPGDLDGIETTQKIRERWDIPVVYLSAYNTEDILNRAKETDAYGFITKDDSLQKQLPVVIEFALFKHRIAKEKYKSHLELRESEEKFRSIINATLDGIVLLDRHGKIIFLNRSAERILGFSEKECFAKSFYELLEPYTSIDMYKKSFEEYYQTGRSDILQQIIELTYFRHNEDMIFIEFYFNTFQMKGKKNACIIIRDATMKKETEGEFERIIEELQISRDLIENNANEMNILNMKLFESEEMLQELNNDKDKFFSIIAHDLKGPFQGLLAYSQLMSEHLDGLSRDEIKEFSHELHESASQLFKLLENLLEWSRIQRGVMEFKPQNIFLREIIEGSIEILKPNATQKEIIVTNQVDSELLAYADYNMVNTVVRNLLSNAIKFTNKGGHIIIESVQIDDEFIEVSVIDDGVGMSDDEIAKVFRIDVHHSRTGTNDEAGTGLGLVLCKDLVEKNSGVISVESEEGKGSTFKFTLPTSRQIA
jgi:PAS domain S-box-containing protein